VGRRRGIVGAAQRVQLIEGAVVARPLRSPDLAEQHKDGSRDLKGCLVDTIRLSEEPHLLNGKHAEFGGARALPPSAETARDEEEVAAERVRLGGQLHLPRRVRDAPAAADTHRREGRQEGHNPPADARPLRIVSCQRWSALGARGRRR
jgi:hypothetical protein